MKKIHLLLALSSITIAISSAFASKYIDVTYYEYAIVEGGPVCIPHTVAFSSCEVIGVSICATTSAPPVQLRAESTGTCGASLYRQ